MTTLTGVDATVAPSLADGGFAGQIIGPQDEGYDDARAVFNSMIDRRPGLIAIVP